MRLSYWHHLRTIIDAMHNFFLGLGSHHFRVILGVDEPSGDQDVENANPQHVLAGEETMAQKPTANKLRKISVAALKLMCLRRKLIFAGRDGKSMAKEKLISMLLVRRVTFISCQ